VGVGPSGMTMGPEVAESMFDFSTLDPGFMNLINSFAETTTATNIPPAIPPQNSNTNSGMGMGIDMDIDAFGSTGLTPFLASTPAPTMSTQHIPRTNSSDISPPYSSGNPSAASVGVAYQAFVTDLPPSVQNSSYESTPAYQSAEGSGQSMGIGGGRGVASDESGSLVGGWFDPADLPKVARDHLLVALIVLRIGPGLIMSRLDLFFSGMRLFGQNFHVPRFFAA
jgi:hypothetical protein